MSQRKVSERNREATGWTQVIKLVFQKRHTGSSAEKKEIDELKCVIQVRLHSLTFFSREEGDMLEQIQDIVVPKIDRNLVKKNFKIKMMFEQMGDGGEKETDW